MRHLRRRLGISANLVALIGLLVALIGAGAASAHPPARQNKRTVTDRQVGAKARERYQVRASVSKAHKVTRRPHRANLRRSIGNAAAVNPSASASSANLLFKATHIEEFWLNQSAPGAVTEVPDPAGSGESVFQMTVGDKDVYPITPTENPRAELVSTPTINPGDELWWSSKFYLPSSFPSSIPSWLTLMEGPYGSPFNGTPPWHIEVSGEHIQWSRNGTYNWDVPWQMPLVKDSWVSVMVHEKFASEGWVEMWIDGKQIDFFSASTYNPNHVAPTQRLEMQTMDASNDDRAQRHPPDELPQGRDVQLGHP